MKICVNLLLSALCVSLLSASALFAQNRGPVTPSRVVEPPKPNSTPQLSVITPQPNVTATWDNYQAMTRETQSVFERAMGRQVGTLYTPLCVSSHAVGGKNYRYFCMGSTTTHPPQTKNVIIDVLVDPAGNVKDKKITDIERKNLLVGWSEFKPLDAKAKEVFGKTLARHQSTTGVPLCVSTQVVAGKTNYRFIYMSDHATDRSKKGNAVGIVNVDSRGAPSVSEIANFLTDNLPRTLQGNDPPLKVAVSPGPQQTAPVQNKLQPGPVTPVQSQPQPVMVPRHR